MRPRSTAGTAVGSRRSTGLVQGQQRSPYHSLGGGGSPHQTGQMLSGQHPGEDFYEAEGEQDPLLSDSRRNLWYRLPPPTRTARRPLPFSRAAATSPAPRRTGGITPAARRHFPAVSPSGAAERRQQATPVIDVAAASQRRLDQMMEGCVMPASVSVFNSLLASRAARGASMPPGHSGVADGGWDVTPWSSGSRGRGSPQPGGRPSAGGIQWGSPAFPSTARGSPPNTGVSWLEGGGAPASAGATPATDTAQLRGEAGGVGTEEGGASPLVAPWARTYAADLSARAQQGDLQAVEELGGMVRVGLPGLPAQPEVARGLLLLAADSGGPPVLGPVCIG